MAPKLHCCFFTAPPLSLGFPGGASGKDPTCQYRKHSSVPGSQRSPRGGHSNPLQYSHLENPHTEEPGRLQSMGLQESNTTEVTEHACTSPSLCISPSLISNYLNLPFQTQGRSWRLESVPHKQESGDKKASVPRSPTWSCSASVVAL